MVLLVAGAFPVPVTSKPSARNCRAVCSARPGMPVPFSTWTLTWAAGLTGSRPGHGWPSASIWKMTSSSGSSGSSRLTLAGSVMVGMVSRVTFLACSPVRLLARASSLLTESRPWSTVSARVARSAILSSWTELVSRPVLFTFWMTEDMNACCSSIRGRSPPTSPSADTPCRVRT